MPLWVDDIIEAVLHILWGLLPVAVLASGPWITFYAAGALAGLLLAVPREVVDQWPIERPWDTLLDLAMFTVGGAFGGAVLEAVL